MKLWINFYWQAINYKIFKIAKNPKYDGYQRALASAVYKFCDKKSSGSGITAIKLDYQLANELHKPIIRKFKKKWFIWRIYIWRYILCAIHLFSKYALVIPLKDKKGTSIVNRF